MRGKGAAIRQKKNSLLFPLLEQLVPELALVVLVSDLVEIVHVQLGAGVCVCERESVVHAHVKVSICSPCWP